jgi:competence protein ComEA
MMKSSSHFNQLGIGFMGVLLGAMLSMGALTLSNRQQPAPIEILPPPPTLSPEPTATPGPLQVYVNGAVRYPDVYELPPGAIVRDAIEAAGGFAADADREYVNLAQPLQSGVQLRVRRLGEETAVPAAVVIPPATAPLESAPARTGNSVAVGLVNINTATQVELETLPGIGPSTAASIISHRDENGFFATIEEIMNVSGIGPAKFAAIQELITVSDE